MIIVCSLRIYNIYCYIHDNSQLTFIEIYYIFFKPFKVIHLTGVQNDYSNVWIWRPIVGWRGKMDKTWTWPVCAICCLQWRTLPLSPYWLFVCISTCTNTGWPRVMPNTFNGLVSMLLLPVPIYCLLQTSASKCYTINQKKVNLSPNYKTHYPYTLAILIVT